jgi:chromosome segregation ATPase
MFKRLRSKIDKRKFYRAKIKDFTHKVYDREFLRNQMRKMRESFRIEHDRLAENLAAAKARLAMEGEKEDKDKTIVENLTRAIDTWTNEVAKTEQRMKEMDEQIDGAFSEEAGRVIGINPGIDELRTTIEMLREEIKKI